MIDLILPCYLVNEELIALTQRAIASFGKVRLIVIDNGSPMGGGFLREHADVYIRNRENLGYAKAVNQGLKLTSSKMIAIANNDVRVSPNWQDVAREMFQEPKAYSCHFRMTDYHVPFQYGKGVWYTGKERWCTSSFFVIKGLNQFYDEHYLNSYDDYDYWWTIRSFGLYTAYTDKACYQHAHSYTQKLIPHREENNKTNMEYFVKKWGKEPEQLFSEKYPEQWKKDYWRGFDVS